MKPTQSQKGLRNMGNPRITIFSAPSPFTGSNGDRQSLAVRSWLSLSPQITVVLFSQDPSVFSFAGEFGSRVLVEPNIDFTYVHNFSVLSERHCSFFYLFDFDMADSSNLVDSYIV